MDVVCPSQILACQLVGSDCESAYGGEGVVSHPFLSRLLQSFTPRVESARGVLNLVPRVFSFSNMAAAKRPQGQGWGVLLWSLQTVASVKSRQLPRPHKFKLDGFALLPLKALGTTDLQKTAFYGYVLRCQNCCFPAISVPDYSLWGRGVIYECYELSKKARFLTALSDMSAKSRRVPCWDCCPICQGIPAMITGRNFEVCMVLSFISHPIFLLPVICFELPITRTPFSISLEGSSYRESSRLQFICGFSLQNVHRRISHLYKRYNNTHFPKFFFKFFSPENSFKYNSTACVNF